MNITAKELSGEHIGKTVTVQFRRSNVNGVLDAIKHEQETILQDLNGEPIRTEQWVELTIGGITQNAIGAGTPITIQEAK